VRHRQHAGDTVTSGLEGYNRTAWTNEFFIKLVNANDIAALSERILITAAARREYGS
jgi:hypothetical protein